MIDLSSITIPAVLPSASPPTGAMLRTPHPYPDESLLGYVTRLTEANGYDHPDWIFSSADLPIDIRRKTALVFNPDYSSLAGLARLTALHPNRLASLCCPPADRTRSRGDCLLFGQPVPRYMVRPGRPKICPDCLREAAYARLVWDFAPVTACPWHYRLLIDECPECKARISWTRKTLCVCRCGCDWRHASPPAPLPDNELILSRAIHRLLKIAPQTSEDQSTLAPLCDLTLRGLVFAIFFVAGQFEGMIDVQGKRLATSRQNAFLHTLLGRARGVFDCWPNNFYSFLDWRRDQFGKTAHSSGLVRDFHEYKAALYSRTAPREFDFLRLAFEDYLRVHWTGGVVGKFQWMKGEGNNGVKFLSRRQVSKALGIPGEGIDALLESGRLCGTARAIGSSRLVLIEAKSVAKLNGELKGALYLRDVKRLLGLSGKAVSKLIAADLLHPLRGPTVDGNSDWQFSLDDATTLLHAFERAVAAGARIAVNQRWSFLHASRRMRQVGIDLSGLVRRVLDGNIVPCGRNAKPGLSGFEFDAKAIIALALENLRSGVGDVLTLKEVCARLRTDTATLVFLARKGIFPARKRPEAPGLGLLITRTEFERFSATYAFLGSVAATLETSPHYLRTMLSRCNIQPVSGPKVDGGPTDIFDHQTLKALDLRASLASSKKKAVEQSAAIRLLSQQDVARRLCLPLEEVHQLVENGVLRQHKRMGGERELRFSSYAVEKLRSHDLDFTGLVSTRVAARSLGKSVSGFHEQFVRRGLLPFIKTKGCRGNLFFQKSAIEALKAVE